jgi:hypothetical protein
MRWLLESGDANATDIFTTYFTACSDDTELRELIESLPELYQRAAYAYSAMVMKYNHDVAQIFQQLSTKH